MILSLLQSLLSSFTYVISDVYFWPSMAVIMMIGVFIGSVLYDGCVKEVKKMVVSLSIYGLLIATVTSSRVIPDFAEGRFVLHHPFSGIATVVLVTLFYLLGIYLGVKITKHAHGGIEI